MSETKASGREALLELAYQHQPYSAITDDPRYFEARSHSPIERNWMWTPPLKHSILVIHDPRAAVQHQTIPSNQPFERVVADDSILMPLEGGETPRVWVERAEQQTPHPVTACNGPQLMKELGFTEEQGNVIWS